jgi:hypothetical protein
LDDVSKAGTFLFNPRRITEMKTPNWRVVSNRKNAQRSTGPRTPEGKAVSSQNAARHYLTSKQVVIPGEDPAEYDALRASLVADLKPANAIEVDLVEELAAGSWRLKRAHRIETAILAGSPPARRTRTQPLLNPSSNAQRILIAWFAT